MEESRERPEAVAAAAPQGKPSGGFWRSLIDIFIDPGKVFARIAAGLSWWKPYIVQVVLLAIFGYFILPYHRRLAELTTLQGLSEEEMQKALANLDKFAPLGLIMVPILIIIMGLIAAAIAHLFVNLMSTLSNFKKTLSLMMYCGLITIIGQIIGDAIVMSRGIEAVESVDDLTVSLSLGDIFPQSPPIAKAFLQSLGVFQIWYYIVLIFGIAAIFKMSKAKAAIPAIAMWLLTFIMLFLGTKFSGGMR